MCRILYRTDSKRVFGIKKAQSDSGHRVSWIGCTGGNIAVSTDMLKQIGCFDENFGLKYFILVKGMVKMSMIHVENLTKSYKVHTKENGLKASVKSLFKREYRIVEAVKSINFDISEGEVVGFIGQNGAGKTTTLKMLSGLLYPTSGKAEVLGFTPSRRKTDYLKQISLVMGQKSQLWWDIPAYDSYVINKEIYALSNETFNYKIKELSSLLEVEHLLKVPVRNLSLGERMKMEIIGSILHSPKVLFLDEPTIGLDITAQKKLREFFTKYNEKYGTTMILTSHYMDDILALCKRIIIINDGEIIFDDSINRVRQFSQDYKILKIGFKEAPNEKFFVENGMKVKEKKDLNYVIQTGVDDVGHAMRCIMDLEPADICIEDQPIEDIIEKIYTRGNA